MSSPPRRLANASFGTSHSRATSACKRAAIYLAKKLTGIGGREIGAVFGVKPAQVSHIVRGIDDHPESPLSRRVNRLRRLLQLTHTAYVDAGPARKATL